MNVVLIGYRGTGKTSVGKKLAERLGFEYFSVDGEIVKEVGMGINEIVSEKGWGFFRAKEKKIIKNIGKDNLVVDCGGGAVESKENVEALKKNSKTVLLTASKETIVERIEKNASRPPLTKKPLKEEVSEMLAKRKGNYENAADFSVDTTGLAVAGVVDKIIELVKE